MKLYLTLVVSTLLLCCSALTQAQIAGNSSRDDLAIVDGGKTTAVIIVSPAADAKSWEKRAATDLAGYIELMTGAKPAMGNSCRPRHYHNPLIRNKFTTGPMLAVPSTG